MLLASCPDTIWTSSLTGLCALRALYCLARSWLSSPQKPSASIFGKIVTVWAVHEADLSEQVFDTNLAASVRRSFVDYLSTLDFSSPNKHYLWQWYAKQQEHLPLEPDSLPKNRGQKGQHLLLYQNVSWSRYVPDANHHKSSFQESIGRKFLRNRRIASGGIEKDVS